MTKKTDPISETLSYYSENASKFVDGTVNVDMGEFYKEFLALVPDGGTILDAGAGSGRDIKYFLDQGYEVVAFDNCPEIVKIASEYSNHEVLQLSFMDITFENKFDGVWACSSLLHVPSSDMVNAINRIIRSLKSGGVFYTSFKYGDDEKVRGGRFFIDYTESRFDELLTNFKNLSVIKYWQTSDLRPGRQDEKWLNILIKKIPKVENCK